MVQQPNRTDLTGQRQRLPNRTTAACHGSPSEGSPIVGLGGAETLLRRIGRGVVYGALVGALGGLLGGLMFDPIYIALQSPDTAGASRCVGFTVIGLMVGLLVGLVDQWTKTSGQLSSAQ